MQTVPTAETGRSLLELNVEPSTAEIYIDDQFQGVVEGWREQTVPIRPGARRLELRAPGYITQRFDLDVADNQHLVLTVRMEREIGSPQEADSQADDDPLTIPPHPTAP